jgi:anti-sigma factor RsiW
MDCDQVRASLEAYARGELDAEATARVAAHLDRCGDCTRELDELTVLIADLRHAGTALRPVGAPSLSELQAMVVPRRRSRIVYIAAAAVGVWAVFLTVLVLIPSAAERMSFLPTGHALDDAARRAAGSGAVADGLRAANLRLRDRLTAVQLGIPVASARAAREYLETTVAKGSCQINAAV